jgi:hypothetical protein
MAVSFSGTKLPQSQLDLIQKEIYATWGTFRDLDIDIQEGHKSGTEVYESKVTVNMAAYSSAGITAGADTLKVDRTPVVLTKIQFKDVVDYNALLDTRFEKSMSQGAFNLVSSEFDNAVLQDISPAIASQMETVTWNGATAAKKALIAGLTPAAPQGSISAGAQTLAAAMPTTLVDSLPATLLHNYSQSKTVPGAGLGDYKKVLSIAAITSATIAAEYAKLYAVIDPAIIADPLNQPVIYAPLAHRQLMRIANNSVGAAQQINFSFDSMANDSKCFYNGIEVKFKPLVGFMIASPPKYLKVLMDLTSDMSGLETGQMANGAEQMWYANVQSYATWCTNQRYIVLYGG